MLDMQRNDLHGEANGKQSPSCRKSVDRLPATESIATKLFIVWHVGGVSPKRGKPLLGDMDAEVVTPSQKACADEVKYETEFVEASTHA